MSDCLQKNVLRLSTNTTAYSYVQALNVQRGWIIGFSETRVCSVLHVTVHIHLDKYTHKLQAMLPSTPTVDINRQEFIQCFTVDLKDIRLSSEIYRDAIQELTNVHWQLQYGGGRLRILRGGRFKNDAVFHKTFCNCLSLTS